MNSVGSLTLSRDTPDRGEREREKEIESVIKELRKSERKQRIHKVTPKTDLFNERFDALFNEGNGRRELPLQHGHRLLHQHLMRKLLGRTESEAVALIMRERG